MTVQNEMASIWKQVWLDSWTDDLKLVLHYGPPPGCVIEDSARWFVKGQTDAAWYFNDYVTIYAVTVWSSDGLWLSTVKGSGAWTVKGTFTLTGPLRPDEI